MAPVLPPASRPPTWKAAAPPPPPGSQTFSAQHALPKLPVPPLEQTLSKLKESLAPLAWSSEELAASAKKVDTFGEGFGKELHQRLIQHASGKEHWLEQWWDDGGYMGYRDSIVVNVSYYYGFKDAHSPETPIHRAASLTRAALLFRQVLKRGELPAEGTKEAPFCMDTFRWMFDACRVPGHEGLDWAVSYAKEGDMGNSGHIVVVRNGRFWRLDTAQDGRVLSTEEIAAQLEHITANSKEPYPGVGILTTSNRDVWARDYLELASNEQNKAILESIQSSAFVLCLDPSEPTDIVSHSRQLWHGATSNQGPQGRMGLETRWVDKPIQLIVFDNGKAGIMGEHSVMDGTPTVTFCDTILDMLASPSFDHGAPAATGERQPQALDFHVSEKTEAAIKQARKAATELIEGQAMGIHTTAYGKKAIKTFGVSPDSWAQMIVQLAYARLLKATAGEPQTHRMGGTYEAATTRRFLKGRTEAIRVVSSESDAWVKAMDDPASTDTNRKELFALAAKKHVERAKTAGSGQGIDRHLLGLKKVLEEGEAMPDMFADPLVQRSSYWVLSTSAVFSKHFKPYGWGEVVPDGFGVAYMTGFDDYLQYTITSRTEIPNAKFVEEIARAAQDMYNLFSAGDVKSKL